MEMIQKQENLLHLAVALLMLYVGKYKCDSHKHAFNALLVVGALLVAYHAYKFAKQLGWIRQ